MPMRTVPKPGGLTAYFFNEATFLEGKTKEEDAIAEVLVGDNGTLFVPLPDKQTYRVYFKNIGGPERGAECSYAHPNQRPNHDRQMLAPAQLLSMVFTVNGPGGKISVGFDGDVATEIVVVSPVREILLGLEVYVHEMKLREGIMVETGQLPIGVDTGQWLLPDPSGKMFHLTIPGQSGFIQLRNTGTKTKFVNTKYKDMAKRSVSEKLQDVAPEKATYCWIIPGEEGGLMEVSLSETEVQRIRIHRR